MSSFIPQHLHPHRGTGIARGTRRCHGGRVSSPTARRPPPQTGQPVLLGGAASLARCPVCHPRRAGDPPPSSSLPTPTRGSAARKAVINTYHHRGETGPGNNLPQGAESGVQTPPLPPQGTPTTAAPFPAQCPPAAPSCSHGLSPKTWLPIGHHLLASPPASSYLLGAANRGSPGSAGLGRAGGLGSPAANGTELRAAGKKNARRKFCRGKREGWPQRIMGGRYRKTPGSIPPAGSAAAVIPGSGYPCALVPPWGALATPPPQALPALEQGRPIQSFQ